MVLGSQSKIPAIRSTPPCPTLAAMHRDAWDQPNAEGSGALTVATVTRRIHLKPGAHLNVRVRYCAPVGTTAEAYYPKDSHAVDAVRRRWFWFENLRRGKGQAKCLRGGGLVVG
jgi:hypothetical protein